MSLLVVGAIFAFGGLAIIDRCGRCGYCDHRKDAHWWRLGWPEGQRPCDLCKCGGVA